MILDKAGQKGTGIWTLQSAISQSVVISTINAAVEARVISSRKDERVAASKILPQPKVPKFSGDRARADRRGARRALRLEDRLLRAGDGAARRGQRRIQMESEFRRHRHHLARRLHHSREVSESHRRGLRARCGAAQSAARSYFTDIIARTQENWRVAVSDRGHAWRRRAGFQRFARLFRQLSLRRGCPRICSRRNATSSARTPTSESTSRASSTPNGWRSETQPTEKPAEPKEQSRAAE